MTDTQDRKAPIKSPLLVRMWRVSDGANGPTAEFRHDPAPGYPKSPDDIMEAPVLLSPRMPAVKPRSPWLGSIPTKGSRHAVAIDQASYNQIDHVGSEGATKIGEDTWYPVLAQLRTTPDGRGVEPVPGSYEAGEALVVLLTHEQVAKGMADVRGRFATEESFDAALKPDGTIESRDSGLIDRAIEAEIMAERHQPQP